MRTTLLIVAIVGLAIFGIIQWKKSNQLKLDLKQVSTDFDLSKQKFTEIRAEDSTLIIIQKELIVDKNSDIAKLIIEKEGLEKIDQQIKIETIFDIPSNVLTEIDSLKTLVKKLNDSTKIVYLELPYSFAERNKWYSYGFTINSKKIIRDSLSFKNTFDITYGFKKRSLWQKIKFQKPEPEVLFNSQNPYIKINNMSNITIRNKVKRSGIGVHAGYDLLNRNLSISIGYNYNLIMF